MSNSHAPVLVTGAGPTGMMAALELARHGIPVRLVEKTLEPATTSRAVGVQARTLELLEQRGLSQALVAKGNPGVAVSVYGAGKRIFRLAFEHVDSRYQYILFVSQAETERVLREALEQAGVAVEWGVTMVAFGQAERSDGIAAVLRRRDGALEELGCSYIISAEGTHSTARQTLGLAFEGRALAEDYALGDFDVDGELPESELHIFSSEHGFLGMFPMGNNRYRLIASNPFSQPSKDTAPAIAELQALYDQRSHIPARFRDLRWSSWFRINSRMIHTMRVGRVFLGGDSAHIHSPAGAQGMNTGMQDMVCLAWKMAMVLKGQAKPALLDTYAAERAPVIQGVLSGTERLTDAIGDENHLFRSVFNHIAPWIVSTDFVQESSTQQMSQLGLGYRDSPLSASHGHGGHLRAGDRAPDMLVAVQNGAGGRAARLFSLLDVSGFTLFYVGGAAPIGSAIAPWRHLIREHQIAPAEAERAAFTALFGTSPGIVLVRPDGYAGFTGTAGAEQALVQYCEQWLLPADANVSLGAG